MEQADCPSTHDEHKIISEDMLNDAKDLSMNTVKIIGEGIQNESKALENILRTLVWLHTFGESFYKGNFLDRGRFEILVFCPFTVFIQMIATFLISKDFEDIAKVLLANIDKAIQFLKDNNWTTADMQGHGWSDSKFTVGWTYGKKEDNFLCNTNGVKLYPGFSLFITHFDANSEEEGPAIECDKYGLNLRE